MKASEVIAKKLLATYPISWEIFEKSCEYSIRNNLSFIKGCLLKREKEVTYNNFSIVTEELKSYLKDLGYDNSIMYHNDTFLTDKGHEHTLVFIVFLSSAAIKAYLDENNKWADSIRGNFRGQVEAKRPIYESIRYQNIWK